MMSTESSSSSSRLTAGVIPFSRDRLSLVSRDAAAEAAFRALTKNQEQRPEVQVAAVAVLFAAWCSRLGIDPHDLWGIGRRMVTPEEFHRKGNIHMETIRDFAGIRLAGDERVDVR